MSYANLTAGEEKIARAIAVCANDYSHGKPGEEDFVRVSVEALGLERDDEREAALAAFIFEDAGETLTYAHDLATFLHRELTNEPLLERDERIVSAWNRGDGGRVYEVWKDGPVEVAWNDGTFYRCARRDLIAVPVREA